MAFGKIQHTVHIDRQSSRRTSPQRLNICRRWRFSYSVTTLPLCTEKSSFLHLADTLSRSSCQDEAFNPSMPDSIHAFHVHLAHLGLTSPALAGPRRPSPIPFASNYAVPHHHALTCTCCSITTSTVGHLLRSSYTINSKHSGTFVKNSALQMVFFLILLAPPPYLSQTKYAEQNPLMPWGSRTLPSFRSRCNFLAQHVERHRCILPVMPWYGKQAATEPILSHPVPTRPWQFIPQDIFEFQQKQYLVTVDHYSDFYELDQLINTQSTTIVVPTIAHFAGHGIPVWCITDNAPNAKEVLWQRTLQEGGPT